jgi:ribose/xylose/arabinose/galactoside ABC-type transport system permease subunit
VEPEHADGPIERDRLAVHAAWEAVLLVALGATAALVWSRSSDALSGDQLTDQLVLAGGNVLLATAVALSLRAAAPNLAAGGLLVGAGALTSWIMDEHTSLVFGAAAGITAIAAALVGVLMGLLVTGLRVPAWAVTIGAAVGLAAATDWLLPAGSRALPAAPDLGPWAWAVFGGAAVLSVVGGAIGARPGVRAALGRWRYEGGPFADRDGGPPATGIVVGALALSCLFAAGAGLVFAIRQQAGATSSGGSLLTTVAALGAALLGGTSVHGRRGGVFGTVLAATALQLLLLWMDLGNVAGWIEVATIAGAVLVGLGVSRMVESLGSPAEPDYVETTPLGDPNAYPTRYVDLM